MDSLYELDDTNEKQEPWKKSIHYLDEETLRRSYIEPGSFSEQQLRLDEIDDLVNEKRYKLAKGLLDEMTPNHDINKAEHSFQLARCHSSGKIKKASLETALYEINNAVKLEPNLQRYREERDKILKDKKIEKTVNLIFSGIGLIFASGLGYAIYELLT